MQEEEKKQKTKADLIKTIIGITLCVIFGFVIICNLTLIIKGVVNPDEPPSIFGRRPIVVLSGSMSSDLEGHLEVGDMIFVKDIEFSELKKGDVVTFKDGGAYTTHRVMGWNEDGSIITKGDANNTEDHRRLVEESLVGVVTGRVPFIGNVALFLQKPLGMFLVVGLPLAAFIVYDILRRQKELKKENDKTSELEAELERLRALAAGNATTIETPVAEQTETEQAPEAPVTEPAEETVAEQAPEAVEAPAVETAETKEEV